MAQYTISEISHLVGITTEGIRFYERKGLISPHRKKDSNIRIYDVWDLYLLMRIKGYQRIGIDLDQIVKIVRDNCYSYEVNLFAQKEKEIEASILYQQHVLERLQKMRLLFRDLAFEMEEVTIEFSPGMYRMDVQHEYTIINDSKRKEVVQKWIQNSPFTYASAFFKQEDILQGTGSFEFGVAIDEKDESYLNLDKQFATYYPPRKSATFIFQSTSQQRLSNERLKPLVDFIRSHNFEMDGDAVSMVWGYRYSHDDARSNFHKVWIPLK